MKSLESNKNLKNQVLSLSDIQELEKLGFEIPKDTIYLWRKQLQDWNRRDTSNETDYHLCLSGKGPIVMGFENYDEVHTLTGQELFERLPKSFRYEGKSWYLSLTGGISREGYEIKYLNTPDDPSLISVSGKNLLEISFKAVKELLDLGIEL